jgi:tetratricopeptide (TPR) repeat protein
MAAVRPAKPFDRTATVIAADGARARGRRKKAIALYRAVLAASPRDVTVHGKLAPLLASTGDRAAALASFRAAADGHLAAGFTDRALAVLAQATDAYPDEEALWDDLTRLQIARGRRADAVAALARGGARLVARHRHDVAERVLRRAGGLEPWHPETTLALARALAGTGRRKDAARLLDGLASRAAGRPRRDARRLAMQLAPGPRTLWSWLRG